MMFGKAKLPAKFIIYINMPSVTAENFIQVVKLVFNPIVYI